MSYDLLASSDPKIILYNTILHDIFSEKCLKSKSAEATNLLHSRDRLIQLQIKCSQQEYEINEMKKRKELIIFIIRKHKFT